MVNLLSANSKKHIQLFADSTDPNARNRGTFLNLENFSFFFFEILKTLLDNVKIIASMSPLSHCGDEEDGCIGVSSWLHCICIVPLVLCLLSTLCFMKQCQF